MPTAFNELKSNTRSWFRLYINLGLRNLGLRNLLTAFTLGTLTVVTNFVTDYDEAIAETPKTQQVITQPAIAGTWLLTPKDPSVSNVSPIQALNIIITKEGKIFIQNPTYQDEYMEVGMIAKTNNNQSLPPNARIINPYYSPLSANQSEGKTSVGTMNRAQQAYFFEKDSWSKNLENLATGIKSETNNYRYISKIDTSITTVKTKPYPGIAINIATAKKPDLKSYVGFVSLTIPPQLNDFATIAILCESIAPTMKTPPLPKWDGKKLKCPDGYSQFGS